GFDQSRLGFAKLRLGFEQGFAVHQAWRMNARRVFDVKGPFRVAAKSIPDPATPAASDITP
ncbi:MAG TPA: hypothetical protein PKU70_13305, partial [Vicinamibacteria bacterium]|nr:hypothetical protein [Vicinamibacteria bacterium]